MGGIFAIILMVIGLIVLIIAAVITPRSPGGIFAGIGLFVFGGVVMLGSSFTSVDEGEVHLPVQFGEALEPIQNKGINFKSPFAGIVVMPTRTVEITFEGAAGGPPTEGETADDRENLREINALTSEGAQVAVDLTVLYHVDPTMTALLYAQVGQRWEDVYVLTRARNTTRDCLPRYTFEEGRTTKRGEAQLCILEAMQSALGPRGLVIEDVLLRDMRADAQLQAAIDAKLEAQSNAQRAEFLQRQAQVEAETARIEAEGRANARIEEATGEAEAIRLQADAEAYANDVIALSLTPELLQLRIYEQLGEKTVVIADGATAPLPILPIGE